MKPIPISFLLVFIPISGSTASAQDETDSDAGDAVRTSPEQQLEQTLERLNGAIKDEPSRYHHDRAEILFRLGRFEESVRDYNEAVRFAWPHNEDSCWERGLAQYYAGDFRAARKLFSGYHRVGPLDIENGLWRLLCIAEEEGIEKARESMLDYSRRVRKPFPTLLEVYMGRGNAEAVLKEATDGVSNPQEITANLFNAHYYLAKYFDMTNQQDLALIHIREALKHKFPHFMYACAEVDAKRLEQARNSATSSEN
jgi:lipoprotein NlpI